MTKKGFLAAYRTALVASYPWAQDEAKLNHFMESVQLTIVGSHRTWNCSGVALLAAWKSLGGKGKPSLNTLRSLPLE